jgi:rhamnosyltransferase
VENRGREISGHFIGLKQYVKQYDYICFTHDKKTDYHKPYMVGESFSYQCFENVLSTSAFVENIITTFQDNPRLGLLVPPIPIHSHFFSVLGNEWQANWEYVQLLAKRLKILVDIDKAKPPISPLGGVYWYKSEALKILFNANFQYEDFPEEPIKETDGTIMHAIERVYQFAAQQAGFYTGWVIADTFAKMEITNLSKMLRDYNQLLIWKFGPNTRYKYMHLIATSRNRGEASIILWKENMKRVLRKVLGRQVYGGLKRMRDKLVK